MFNKGELPADIEDLYHRAHVLKAVSKGEPAMEPIVIQLKYGPWRSAVVRAWRADADRVQCPASHNIKSRAQSLLRVLVQAAKMVNKKGVSKWWAQNAGRNVSWHAGGVMVLHGLGVLIAQPVGSQGMTFQREDKDDEDKTQTTQWRVAQTLLEVGAAVDKLKLFIHAWDNIHCIFTAAPTTIQGWSNQMTKAWNTLQSLPSATPQLPHGSKQKYKYTSLWTFRGCMLLRMHQAGIGKLKVGEVPLQKFLCMNPDEHNNLLRVFQANRATIHTTRDFLQHCNVQRPELLSMEFCLASSGALDNVDFENMDVVRWRRVKEELKMGGRLSPHIACIAERIHQLQEKPASNINEKEE